MSFTAIFKPEMPRQTLDRSELLNESEIPRCAVIGLMLNDAAPANIAANAKIFTYISLQAIRETNVTAFMWSNLICSAKF